MINVHLQLYSPMETILLRVVSHEEVEYCIIDIYIYYYSIWDYVISNHVVLLILKQYLVHSHFKRCWVTKA